MPPSVTQILQTHVSTDSVDYCLRQNEKEKQANKQKETDSPSIYDISLATIPQPWFLKPVRAWEKRVGFVTPIRWINTTMITLIHAVMIYWFAVKMLQHGIRIAKWQSFVFSWFMGQVSGFGVTAGVHRYWCHRSYKARWPLKIILLICYSAAGQNTIYEWVRDHRVHHKFSETTADPHDANRGFFFSHVGWLMMKKHPHVIREGQKMDLSDITNDPFVKFHTKYFFLFKALFCWILPSFIPWLCWNETPEVSFISQALVRYVMSLHFTWSVNSFAHLWGNKPYDKNIMPAENLGVSLVSMGEGWHNYHHTFPWDYKAAELGGSTTNITTTLLNLFAKIGWAYDMKKASPELVRAVAEKRGDHHHAH